VNASEKEITGVEDMSGLGSIRDALMAQAVTLARLDARDEARERARNEAREADVLWKSHMTDNVGKLFDGQTQMRGEVAAIPELVDKSVSKALTCRDVRAFDRRRLINIVLIVVGILAGLGVAAALEFYDSEVVAGRVLLILMPLVTLAGWYISARRK
jgi:hypothetical protein